MTQSEILLKERTWLDEQRHVAAAKERYLSNVVCIFKGCYSWRRNAFVSKRGILNMQRKYENAKAAHELWSMWCVQKDEEFLLEQQL